MGNCLMPSRITAIVLLMPHFFCGSFIGTLRSEEWLPLTPDMATPFGQIAPSGLIQSEKPHETATQSQRPSNPVSGPPTHAVLRATLATWDNDFQADGWQASVQLRDAAGNVVIPFQANAAFELRLRTPTRDRSGFEDVRGKSIRWSTKLEFGDSGVATVRLPLRNRLPSPTGAGSVPRRWTSHRNANFEAAEQSGRYVAFGNGRTQNLESLTRPHAAYGVVRVRVSVPSVGVLEAIDTITGTEPALVNTHW
jgi:hypothetical protein